jgi:hypothetical protein
MDWPFLHKTFGFFDEGNRGPTPLSKAFIDGTAP